MPVFPKLPKLPDFKNLSVEDARTAARRHLRTRRGLLAAGLAGSLLVGGGGAAVAATVDGGQDAAPSSSAQQADSGAKQAPDKGTQQAEPQPKPDTSQQAEPQPKPDTSQQAKPQPKPEPAQPGPSDWTLPVHKPYKLTAGFGKAGGRWSHDHSGQDFAVNTGTEVDTVHTGTVVKAGWGGAYGNRIVIEHAPGQYSEYAHLSKIDVSVGQHVNTGQEIGVSGATGNVTGPHLHFEIRTTPNYGSGIDPMPFLQAHGLNP